MELMADKRRQDTGSRMVDIGQITTAHEAVVENGTLDTLVERAVVAALMDEQIARDGRTAEHVVEEHI